MSKRTNKIYNVQVAQYAWMAVEADSPKEAILLASRFADEHITDEDFEDSDVSVVACENYASNTDDYELGERIFTVDGVMSNKKYREQLPTL